MLWNIFQQYKLIKTGFGCWDNTVDGNKNMDFTQINHLQHESSQKIIINNPLFYK